MDIIGVSINKYYNILIWITYSCFMKILSAERFVPCWDSNFPPYFLFQNHRLSFELKTIISCTYGTYILDSDGWQILAFHQKLLDSLTSEKVAYYVVVPNYGHVFFNEILYCSYRRAIFDENFILNFFYSTYIITLKQIELVGRVNMLYVRKVDRWIVW